MGAQYGQRLPRLTCQKRANAGDSIHRQPGKECEKQVSGTGFNQHQKAVSVVLVRFSRIRFRQRSASQMIDYAFRLNSAAVSCLTSTPAEIDVLHVNSELYVYAAQSKENLLPDRQRYPWCP